MHQAGILCNGNAGYATASQVQWFPCRCILTERDLHSPHASIMEGRRWTAWLMSHGESPIHFAQTLDFPLFQASSFYRWPMNAVTIHAIMTLNTAHHQQRSATSCTQYDNR